MSVKNLKSKLTRRSFLQSHTLGVSAFLALPPLEIMFESEKSYAAASEQQNFLSIYLPNGVYEKNWYPELRSTDIEFSTALPSLKNTALEAIENKNLHNDISLYKGLTNVCAIDPSNGHAHLRAICSWLTGVALPNDEINTHDWSLDQQFAESTTRRPNHSLVLAGNSERFITKFDLNARLANGLSWNKDGQLIPLKSDLREIFKKLFDNTNSLLKQTDKHLGISSILDDVQDHRKTLINILGAEDLKTVEAYFDNIRDLEKQLHQINEFDSNRDCKMPTFNGSLPSMKNERRNAKIGDHAKAAAKLIALAFQCQLISSASYAFGGETSGAYYPEIGINKHFHNGLSHNSLATDEKHAIDKFHGDLCAEFLNELKQTPTSTGTLLDCTAFICGSGLGDSASHSFDNLAMLVGGRIGQWQHGNLHNFPGRNHADLIDTMRKQLNLESLGLPEVPIVF